MSAGTGKYRSHDSRIHMVSELKRIRAEIDKIIADNSDTALVLELKAKSTLVDAPEEPTGVEQRSKWTDTTYHVMLEDVDLGRGVMLKVNQVISISGSTVEIVEPKVIAESKEEVQIEVREPQSIGYFLDTNPNSRAIINGIPVIYTSGLVWENIDYCRREHRYSIETADDIICILFKEDHISVASLTRPGIEDLDPECDLIVQCLDITENERKVKEGKNENTSVDQENS